jgi:class 3 adenylate cyclase
VSRGAQPDGPEAAAAGDDAAAAAFARAALTPISESTPSTLASSPGTGRTNPGAQVLANYLPRHRLERLRTRAAAAADPAPAPHDEVADVALLYVDLTGFTRMTEEYARRGRAGAEELAELLDRLFGRVGVLAAQNGGDLLTVAGDAALAMFPTGAAVAPREAVRRAAACALAVQRELATRPIERLSELRLRAGVSFGQVRLLELGGVRGRWESLVVGAPLADVTAAAAAAAPGSVLAAASAVAVLEGQASLEPECFGRARVEAVTASPVELPPRPAIEDSMLPLVERHVPSVVLERVRAGQLDWLAEIRIATLVFVNLPDLDPDRLSLARLDAAVGALQSWAFDCDAEIYDCAVDDKGTTFILAFGVPPHAHADDPARAVLAALAIQRSLAALDVTTSVGVTTGRVFSGVFGTAVRAHYTLRGPSVNLAARLMLLRRGDLLCDAPTAHAAGARLEFAQLATARVKGRDHPVELRRPRCATCARDPRGAILRGRASERRGSADARAACAPGAPPPASASAPSAASSASTLPVLREVDDAIPFQCGGGACRVEDEPMPSAADGERAEVDGLPPSPQLVLKTASVIGSTFSLELLRGVHPLRRERPVLPELLASLVRLGLLRASPDAPSTFTFVHEATRARAYDLLLLSQRRRLHRRIARWYERSGSASDALTVADHWERAGKLASAVDWLERAASTAPPGAARVELLERALALAARPELAPTAPIVPRRLASWLLELGVGYARLGDRARAREALGRALVALGLPPPRSRFSAFERLASGAARRLGRRVASALRGAERVVQGEVGARDADAALADAIHEALARL